MSPPCRLSVGAGSGPAEWRREPGRLLITPRGAPPLAVALADVAGIGGDGFRIEVRLGGDPIALERLGADGPPLLEAVRREWLPLRARALRLSEAGTPERYAGEVATDGAQPQTFAGFLEGPLLLLARDGGDVEPLFLARWSDLEFDEAAHAVVARGWSGERTVFRRLGLHTQGFFRDLEAARAALPAGGGDVLARRLPTLDGAARAALAAHWVPGRFLSLAALDALQPGFSEDFRRSWLAACPRRAEGEALLAGVPPEQCLLGYAATGPSPSGAAPDEEGNAAAESVDELLVLLAARGGLWCLEVLSQGDFATYRFQGDPGLPALAEALLNLPRFSREALSQPLEKLTGDRSEYAVPARDLVLLRDLRALFAGRVVHSVSWRSQVGL